MSGTIHSAVMVLLHPTEVAKEMDGVTRKAGNAARREIRHLIPRARKGARLPRGSRPGQARGAVHMFVTGRGFDAAVKVHAGGISHILIPGAAPHSTSPLNAKALHLSSALGADFARGRIPHPGLAGIAAVELGAIAAGPAIEVIMAETGHAIVTEMARRIERGI